MPSQTSEKNSHILDRAQFNTRVFTILFMTKLASVVVVVVKKSNKTFSDLCYSSTVLQSLPRFFAKLVVSNLWFEVKNRV